MLRERHVCSPIPQITRSTIFAALGQIFSRIPRSGIAFCTIINVLLWFTPLQNQYCWSNKCYTPTEFALFGIGICVLGILIGIVAVAWFRNQCSAEDKYYSYRYYSYKYY